MSSKEALAPRVPESGRPRRRTGHGEGFGWGFLVKLVLMALVNAMGIMAAVQAFRAASWLILGVAVVLLLAADIVYFTKKTLPLKYLLPGLAFLLVFQVFIFGYTAYIAFTNYGTGHVGSQEQAVDAALSQGERRVEGSPTYQLAVVERGDTLGFAINDGGTVKVGSETDPLQVAAGAVASGTSAPTEVPGWSVVSRQSLISDQALQQRVVNLRVPISDDPNAGSIRTLDGLSGAVYKSTLTWDAAAQTITDASTGTVYRATAAGTFRADDGTTLPTGWVVNVGFDNFLRLFTDSTMIKPLAMVTAWTFGFAILSVLLPFALGLLFAIIYNDPRVRGRKSTLR